MKEVLIMFAIMAMVEGTNAQLKVLNNGYVGIGTNLPERKLDVRGEVYITSDQPDWGRAVWTKVRNRNTCAYNLFNSYYNRDVFYVCGEGYTWSMVGNYIGSDIALKKNIKSIDGALDLVKKLNGVRYQYIDVASEKDSSSKISNGYRLGFVAQEVEKVLPEVVKEMHDGTKSIAYTDLIAVLVESIKEQQNQIDVLKKVVSSQEKEMISLKEDQRLSLEELVSIIQECCNQDIRYKNSNENSSKSLNDNTVLEEIILYQNVPNPFTSNTKISYTIPISVQSASLHIYDLNGVELLSFSIIQRGTNTTIIDASSLSAGMYLYTLIADDAVVDTKRMVLTK